MEAGENMSYGWSGEVKQDQLTRVVGARHDETFLMMIGKGARQTRDIQTMGLVHTKHQGENNMIGWMCQQKGARVLNLKDSVSAMKIKWGQKRDLRYMKGGTLTTSEGNHRRALFRVGGRRGDPSS